MIQNKAVLASQAEEDALAEALEDKYVSEVSNRMLEIETINAPDMKRWVWELIQNAKDSIAYDPNRNHVDIKLKVEDDIMEFRHNGSPFTHKARIALMYKHSSGKDNHQTTGRFGTGFLTTHRLSRVVDVKSNVIDKQGNISGFKFTLDRNGNTQDELREGLQRMRDSREWIDPQEWTSFIYKISDEMGRESLNLGLESFHKLISATMIFCPEINSISLDNKGVSTEIHRGTITPLRNGVKKIELIITHSGNRSIQEYLMVEGSYSFTDKIEANIKMLQQVTASHDLLSHGNSCGFFCALPLEGIENQLIEPVIINCERFESTTERQRLKLKGPSMREDGSFTTIGINKGIYSAILNLYKILAGFIVEEGYGNLFYLANGLKGIKTGIAETDEEWYKNNVQASYQGTLKALAVVKDTQLKPHLLNEVIIVKEQSTEKQNELFNLLLSLYPDKLIENNNEWASVIWKDEELKVWDLEDVCAHIASSYPHLNDIPNLAGEDLFTWYNQFLTIVLKRNANLLVNYALLPDMYGKFHKKDGSLKQNINVSTQALEILNKLGKDKRGELLHQNITALTLEGEYNSTSLAADINKRVEEVCKENGWLDKLMPLMAAIPTDDNRYPNHPGFCKKRKDFLNIAKALYGYRIEEVEENSLIADSWRELDKRFVNAALRKLSELGKLSALPSGLDISWLNHTLIVLNPTAEQWKNYTLLPNQYGDFKKREEVLIDNGVENVLKADILKNIHINPRIDLLDTAIDAQALGIEKAWNTSGVVTSIRKCFESNPSYSGVFVHSYYGRFYKYPLQTLLPISRYLVGLLPTNKDSEQFELQDEFRTVVDTLSNHEIPYIGMINYSDGNLWTVPNMLVAKNVFGRLESDQTLEATSQRLGGIGTKCVIDLLNGFYSVLNKLRISYKGNSIIPNQHGVYCKFASLYDESPERDEELKDIANEIPGGQDFRQILIHPEVMLKIGIEKSNEQIALFVDNIIGELFDRQSNWQNEQFKNAVTKFIEIWEPKHRDLFKKCFNASTKKDAITVNVIITQEVRSRLQALVRTGADISVIEKANENAQRVSELEAQVAELKRQLQEQDNVGFRMSDGSNDLSAEQQHAYLEEAKELILKNLAENGYDVSAHKWNNYTYIDGVRKNGSDIVCPIVFRSNRSHRSTVIIPDEWDILMQSNAMFGVVTKAGVVQTYNIRDLLSQSDYITLRFSTKNCDIPERMDKLSQAFRYFKGIQFDFEKFIVPTQYAWQNFFPPELNTSEKPARGTLDLF